MEQAFPGLKHCKRGRTSSEFHLHKALFVLGF